MFNSHRNFDLTTGMKGATIAVIVGPKETSVLYHKTVVFRWDRKTGKVFINNGGWATISTTFVINRALSQCPGFQSYYLKRVSRTHYLHSCYLPAPIQLRGEEIKLSPKRTLHIVESEPA